MLADRAPTATGQTLPVHGSSDLQALARTRRRNKRHPATEALFSVLGASFHRPPAGVRMQRIVIGKPS